MGCPGDIAELALKRAQKRFDENASELALTDTYFIRMAGFE
jgi:hypothetical protein